MRVPPLRIRAVGIALAAGAAILALGSSPRAQAPALNGKQRLLAGEALPVNRAEQVRLRKEQAAANPKPVYAPGRVLVKLADGGTEQSLRALAVRSGGHSVTRSVYADFVVVHIDPAADVVAAAADLSTQPGVVYAEPDAILYPMYVPNDPFYDLQWNFQKI